MIKSCNRSTYSKQGCNPLKDFIKLNIKLSFDSRQIQFPALVLFHFKAALLLVTYTSCTTITYTQVAVTVSITDITRTMIVKSLNLFQFYS